VTEEQIREVVTRCLSRVAPEADLAALEPDVNFRDQLDIDSMDFLNFVIGVCEELEIDVPEADYPRFSSLDGGVAYLANCVPWGPGREDRNR
jgi:acyl carrier protein